MFKSFLLSITVAFCFLAILFSTTSISVVVDAAECTKDSDCFAMSCCHASVAVAKDRAPNCKGVVCDTSQCQPYTIDCGGYVRCEKTTGTCEAVYGSAPAAPVSVGDGAFHKHKRYTYYRAKVGSGYHHGRQH